MISMELIKLYCLHEVKLFVLFDSFTLLCNVSLCNLIGSCSTEDNSLGS